MASIKELVQAQGKAFNTNPAWEDPGRPVGVWDLNLGRIAGGSPTKNIGGQRISQKNAGRHMSAYAGKEAMDWVWDCARFWADTVSNAEYHFTKPQEPSAEKVQPEAVAGPKALVELLKKPNPYQDYIEFMELLTIDLLLVGNAYFLKWKTNGQKQPLALYRLAPPYVEIATTPWGPGGYIYQIPNSDKILIEPEEIIHLRLANPDGTNPYYGAGIISGAGRAADLEIALTSTQQNYYENAAMPSATVESERRVPRDVFKKMRQQLRSRAQGPRAAGELLVLEAGLKMNTIAPNATQAAFAEVAKMSRDRCFSWFKMNPVQVGIADGNLPTSFLGEYQKHWDSHHARPFMNKLQRKLTDELTTNWSVDFVIDYEMQMTPEERAKHAGMVGAIPGVDIGEVREAGGMPPHKDKSINSTTINLPGEEAGTGLPGDPTRKGFPDKNLPGEGGRPPKPSNTKAFPRKGGALPKGAKARKAEGKSVDEVLARLDELIASPAARETPDQLVNKRTADVDRATGSFVEELQRAAHVLERSILDVTEGKAVEDSGILANIKKAPGWPAFEDMATAAYEQALLKVMSAAAVHHGELGLKPAGEIDYEALIDELVGHKDTGVKAITTSLRKAISQRVQEARSSGEPVQPAVQDAVSQWVANKAPMIAVTEATRGYNASTLEVAEKAGLEKVQVSDGTDDDQPCVDANGSIWTLAYAREHSLEHPRCRRAFVPITA